MDAKKADLSKYKAELLAKVDAHAKEIEHAHEKEAQVHKFSEEMKMKVREHESHFAARMKMMESLKDDITKSARSFYGGAYCVDESV
jgi:predicted Holliday junction resolvase-like endonuclease